MGSHSPSSGQLGFSYIGLLIAVAIMEAMLAATAEFWHTTTQRQKEEELLFVGDQFRQAIRRYTDQTPGGIKRYPMNLDDLLKDPRYPNTRRYLRKIYVDPMTGIADWGLVRGPNGEIYGVYSRSEDEPIKKANFRGDDIVFEGRRKYSEWQFLYVSGQAQSSLPQPSPKTARPTAGKVATPFSITK